MIDVNYKELYASAAIRSYDMGKVESIAGRILENRAQYEKVESGSGVPWYVVACIHSLEANLNFSCHLHNGDPLTARTIHVPAGRPVAGSPPFAWYESAIDALSNRAIPASWTVAAMLEWMEAYNGFGYRIYHPSVLSPYLWSMTNQYTSGKYAADGVFDPNLVSQQVGAVAILKLLEERGIIEF